MLRTLARGAAAALLVLAMPASLIAQQGTGVISGRVTDKATGAPVANASVQARPSVGGSVGTRTGADGSFRIPVAAGRYVLRAQHVAYGPVEYGAVDVAAGATPSITIAMTASPRLLEQVVTTGSRGTKEKILDSQNSISVVQAGQIAERPSVTFTDHLKAQPGLSISTGGIGQANIVSRGFNNAFSTQMLMLQDYRYASVPSLRVNVPMLFTGTNEDIERIEVLQGPAAALYGPNSGNGVLHVITKSPFDAQGATITLDGGTQSLGRGSLRYAALAGSKVAYKVSGEYITAKDFRYTDPNEPATWVNDARVPAERRGKPASRDFDVQKVSGEARIDVRPGANTELISTAGFSKIGSGIEITTTFGAAQVKDWSYLTLQERFRHKSFFAQVFYNASDAGNKNANDPAGTFYLRTGIPVVDRSNVLTGQVQQGLSLGRTKFVLGGDYIATKPKTEGTINGRNENDDNITEYGAYAKSTTPLGARFDFHAAVRGDVNSRIEGSQFSPSAALVFKATDKQNFRLTFNRAFSSPAAFSFFLDQFSGTTPAPGLPVQIMGNRPKQGWQFSNNCTAGLYGGLCMRSPYVPTTGPAVTASAAAAYPGFVGGGVLEAVIRAQPASAFGAGGEATRQALLSALPIIRGLRPTDAQVGTVLVDLNSSTPLAGPPGNYAPLGANFSNTWEVGYKGILGARTRIAMDLWFQKRPSDPTTQILNPGVLFNGPQLGAYWGQAIAGALIAQGMPAAQAQAQATALAGGLATVAAKVPVGAAAFTDPNYTNSYLVFSYQNGTGYVNVSGIDLAADFVLGRGWSLGTTYSHLSPNVFEDAPGATKSNPLVANTPKHRGTATFRYESVKGFSGEVRGRYADAFPVNSGVFNSYGNPAGAVRYGPVPVNALIDAGISWALPMNPNARWSLNATNLLDNKVPTFVGVPDIGRLVMTRVSYTF